MNILEQHANYHRQLANQGTTLHGDERIAHMTAYYVLRALAEVFQVEKPKSILDIVAPVLRDSEEEKDRAAEEAAERLARS